MLLDLLFDRSRILGKWQSFKQHISGKIRYGSPNHALFEVTQHDFDARARDQRKKVLAPGARRQAVAHLQEVFEVSQRRACALLGADRTMVRYISRRPDDAKARERIRELASQRRRFGYRRLHWLLCR
jgi:hypothetical protein